ncbi:MAG: hypothetical protein OHK0053_06590 [Microscillaceae bacterium]
MLKYSISGAGLSIAVWLAVMALEGCHPRETSYLQHPAAAQLLIGTWQSGESDLYHTLYFQDSLHLVLDSHLDTLFYYTYRLRGDSLWLYREYGRPLTYCLILKLSPDSLVFAQLLDRAGPIRYGRKQ